MSYSVCCSKRATYYDVPYEVLEGNRPKSDRLELLKRVIYDTPRPKRGFADFFVKVVGNTRTFGDWIIKVFLEDNMDPNVTDQRGDTSLYYVVSSTNSYSTEKTLRMLLEHGADVNGQHKISSYLTDAIFFPLIYSRSLHVKTPCCMILEAGADVENDRFALRMWHDLCFRTSCVGIEYTWILDMLIEAI